MKKWPIFFFSAVCMCLTVRPAIAQQGASARPSTHGPAPAVSLASGPSSNTAFPGFLMTGKMKYSVANTHSHNDYEQAIPFWMAWQEQFGSIEADIFLQDGLLLVGHNREEIKAGRTLEEYYVKPLLSCVEKNNGYPYSDTARRLQILIDVKADSIAALNALVTLLNKYPAITHASNIKWVISGNRPSPDLYASYPSFIAFDGILRNQYTPEALSRVVMMSDDLRSLTRTRWNGQTQLPAEDIKTIEDAITRAHQLHLPVRLWDAPDTSIAWDQLMQLHVDYINTDHIRELATYLNENAKRN